MTFFCVVRVCACDVCVHRPFLLFSRLSTTVLRSITQTHTSRAQDSRMSEDTPQFAMHCIASLYISHSALAPFIAIKLQSYIHTHSFSTLQRARARATIACDIHAYTHTENNHPFDSRARVESMAREKERAIGPEIHLHLSELIKTEARIRCSLYAVNVNIYIYTRSGSAEYYLTIARYFHCEQSNENTLGSIVPCHI